MIDLGLRLDGVAAMGLESEDVVFPPRLRKSPRQRLVRCGATKEECAFLVRSDAAPYEGRRVELNAMASRQFLNFLERKLADHGVVKVVPGREVLAKAYRLAYRKAAAQKAIDDVMKAVAGRDVDVPENLARKVARRLGKEATESWDEAITKIAGEAFGGGD